MEGNKLSEAGTDLILKIYDDHGRYVINELRGSLERRKLNRMPEQNLNWSLVRDVSVENGFAKLNISFEAYGRYIEIRWFRIMKNRRAFQKESTNRALFGYDKTFNRIKRADWYSSTAYGTQNALIAALRDKLPPEILEQIRRNFIEEKLTFYFKSKE